MHFKYIFLHLLLCSSSIVYSQISEKLTFSPYIKSHTFFNPGSHKVSDKNNAYCRGAGTNVYYLAKPKIRLVAGYGLGIVDSLQYDNNYTKNATFHQLDINGVFSIAEGKRIQPLLYIGYAFNYIPQLADFNKKTLGTNLNIGYGLDVKLTNYLSAVYTNTYGVSLSEDYRYNFRHQLGINYNFNLFQNRKTIAELASYQSRLEYDLALIGNLEVQNDSLTQISNQVTSKTVENYKLKEEVNSLKASKATLEKEYAKIQAENRDLNAALRTYQFFRDSVTLVRQSDFYALDSVGNIVGSVPQILSGKWYVGVINYTTYSDALSMLNIIEQNGVESPMILYHGGYYTILGYLTSNSEKVIEGWNAISNKTGNFKLYQF